MYKLIVALVAFAFAGTVNADEFDVYGLWLTQAKDAHVEVTDCEDGTPCGVLVWFDPQRTESDYDIRNADIDQQGRSLIGIPIVWGFERGQKGWRKGHIYNPEYGEIYASSMRLQKRWDLES